MMIRANKQSGKVMIKIIKIILLCFLVFSMVLFIAYKKRNKLISYGISVGVEKVLGSKVEIEKFDLDWKNESITMKDFKLYNPEPFTKEGVLLGINEASIKIDIEALKQNKIHIPKLKLDIDKIVVVENQNKVLNVTSFKNLKSEDKDVKEEKKEKDDESLSFVIDELFFSVNEIIHKKYDEKGKATIKVYSDIGLKDKEYKNITSPKALISSVIGNTLRKTAIKSGLIYGLAASTGVGLVPVAATTLFVGKSSSDKTFQEPYEKVIDAVIAAIKDMGGEIKDIDKKEGKIKAKTSDCSVKVKISDEKTEGVKVKVGAKKLMVIQPKVAAGIIHEIERILNAEK